MESENALEFLRRTDLLVFPDNPCKIVSDPEELPYFVRFMGFAGSGYYCFRSPGSGEITEEVYYLDKESVPAAATFVRARYRELRLAKMDKWTYEKWGTYGVGGYSDIVKKTDILRRKISKPDGISWRCLLGICDAEIDSMCIGQIVKTMKLSVEKAAELITARRVPDFVKDLQMTIAA